MKMVMTPYERVFNAFLAKILDDEWAHWEWEEVQIDLRELLEGGIPWFKFPRVDLDRNDEGFYAELGPEEVQILATYMKCEWLNRTILSWENIKPFYDERDFSQANLLDKFNETLENEKKNASRLEAVYYRSIKGKPFKYSRLASRID